MASDAEILELVRGAFAIVERPEHFTNFNHCCECFEDDETLRARDLDTLTFDDMGNGAWDPIAMTTPVAFAYFIPALARIALDEPHPYWGWFGPQLCWHLEADGARNRRWLACTPEQRKVVSQLLEHINHTRLELINEYDCGNELLRAYEVWRDDGT